MVRRRGKGACQGSFCSVRTAAHLCRQRDFPASRGLAEIREFVGEEISRYYENDRPMLQLSIERADGQPPTLLKIAKANIRGIYPYYK